MFVVTPEDSYFSGVVVMSNITAPAKLCPCQEPLPNETLSVLTGSVGDQLAIITQWAATFLFVIVYMILLRISAKIKCRTCRECLTLDVSYLVRGIVRLTVCGVAWIVFVFVVETPTLSVFGASAIAARAVFFGITIIGAIYGMLFVTIAFVTPAQRSKLREKCSEWNEASKDCANNEKKPIRCCCWFKDVALRAFQNLLQEQARQLRELREDFRQYNKQICKLDHSITQLPTDIVAAFTMDSFLEDDREWSDDICGRVKVYKGRMPHGERVVAVQISRQKLEKYGAPKNVLTQLARLDSRHIARYLGRSLAREESYSLIFEHCDAQYEEYICPLGSKKTPAMVSEFCKQLLRAVACFHANVRQSTGKSVAPRNVTYISRQ